MIDYQLFLNWAEERFYDVVTSGNEIQLNSIFKTDQKHKLWCNPTKGPFGAYHCWKTNESGNLIQFVRQIDGLDWEDAAELLGIGGHISFKDLSEKVAEFFVEKPEKQENLKIEIVKLELPESTYLIKDLPSGNPYRQKAETHLMRRKLPIDNLYVCTQGLYRNRLVIPYYDHQKKLIYYNCRTLIDEKPKYRGPPKSLNIGKLDVVYMPKWPIHLKTSKHSICSNFIFLTEGELDALTISISGLWSAALGGKVISGIQVDMLKNMRLVIAFDRDKAGEGAFLEVGDYLELMGLEPYYVQPPKEFKDWNDLLVKYNKEVVEEWLFTTMKRYDRVAFLEKSIL